MNEIRHIRIEGDIAYVPLTRGHEAVIDVMDVSLIKKRNWFAVPAENTVYACCCSRSDENGKRHTISMHRFITNAPFDVEVDHRDRNGLNNRRLNLRFATASQNQHNQKIHQNNTSGFKGVYWYKQNKKWRAQIYLKRKLKFLGYFNNREKAAEAYAEASRMLHGDFGRVA